MGVSRAIAAYMAVLLPTLALSLDCFSPGMEYVGHQVWLPVYKRSPKECQQTCANTLYCAYFTWRAEANMSHFLTGPGGCMLFNDQATLQPSGGDPEKTIAGPNGCPPSPDGTTSAPVTPTVAPVTPTVPPVTPTSAPAINGSSQIATTEQTNILGQLMITVTNAAEFVTNTAVPDAIKEGIAKALVGVEKTMVVIKSITASRRLQDASTGDATASTVAPVALPTVPPVAAPTVPPVAAPTVPPVAAPTVPPVAAPTVPPVAAPTVPPVAAPTVPPVAAPTVPPVAAPTVPPVAVPTVPPTVAGEASSVTADYEIHIPGKTPADLTTASIKNSGSAIQSGITDALNARGLSQFSLKEVTPGAPVIKSMKCNSGVCTDVDGGKQGGGFPWWAVLLIVLVIVGVGIAVIYGTCDEKKKKKKKDKKSKKESRQETSPAEAEALMATEAPPPAAEVQLQQQQLPPPVAPVSGSYGQQPQQMVYNSQGQLVPMPMPMQQQPGMQPGMQPVMMQPGMQPGMPMQMPMMQGGARQPMFR